MRDIVIIGAGGFGREVACLIHRINQVRPEWNLLGFIDENEAVGTKNPYGKVLGNLDYVNRYQDELSVVMGIATPEVLERISGCISNTKIDVPNLIDPS